MQRCCKAHAEVLRQDRWIIDGYGGLAPAWGRFARADTLVYIDLPLATHAWYVTKRLIKGLFMAPEGWPDKSPLLSSSIASYRALWPCHHGLTPRYRQLVAAQTASKRVHHLKSPAEVARLLDVVRRECAGA
jgi:hypothetical protein